MSGIPYFGTVDSNKVFQLLPDTDAAPITLQQVTNNIFWKISLIFGYSWKQKQS